MTDQNFLQNRYSIQQSDAPESAGNLDFVDGFRSDHEFEKAKRHTDRVRWLRILLPVIAGLIILLIVGALVVRQLLSSELDLGLIKMDGGKLIMADVGLGAYYGGWAAAVIIEGDNAYALHRGERVPIPAPGSNPETMAAYFEALRAIDPEPAGNLQDEIDRLMGAAPEAPEPDVDVETAVEPEASSEAP